MLKIWKHLVIKPKTHKNVVASTKVYEFSN